MNEKHIQHTPNSKQLSYRKPETPVTRGKTALASAKLLITDKLKAKNKIPHYAKKETLPENDSLQSSVDIVAKAAQADLTRNEFQSSTVDQRNDRPLTHECIEAIEQSYQTEQFDSDTDQNKDIKYYNLESSNNNATKHPINKMQKQVLMMQLDLKEAIKTIGTKQYQTDQNKLNEVLDAKKKALKELMGWNENNTDMIEYDNIDYADRDDIESASNENELLKKSESIQVTLTHHIDNDPLKEEFPDLQETHDIPIPLSDENTITQEIEEKPHKSKEQHNNIQLINMKHKIANKNPSKKYSPVRKSLDKKDSGHNIGPQKSKHNSVSKSRAKLRNNSSESKERKISLPPIKTKKPNDKSPYSSPNRKHPINHAKASNKLTIVNSIRMMLLGDQNRKLRDVLLLKIKEYNRSGNLIMLLQDASAKQNFIALYEYDAVKDKASLFYSLKSFPKLLKPEMIEYCYNYSSDSKEFKAISGCKRLSPSVDAVSFTLPYAKLWKII